MSDMKKEEILKERFWVMPLHAILRVLDKLLVVMVSLISLFVIFSPAIIAVILGLLALLPSVILILLAFKFLPAYLPANILVYLFFVCITFVVAYYLLVFVNSSKRLEKIYEKIMDKIDSWFDPLSDRFSPLLFRNPNLSGRLLQHYEKRWGMTNEEIENYISHRTQLGGDDSILYLLPIVSWLCQLNKSARKEQKAFLSVFLDEYEIEDALNKEYSDAQRKKSYRYWRGKEWNERKALMELLFKLTIEQDGIHNDEWYMLIHIMTQLKFNNREIEYFKNRYFSLRTEFDDYKRKKTSSKVKKPIASLNPYYAILELKEGASIEEIKRAYHNLALKHHPDLPKNAGKIKECEEMMKKINEAYEKLRG